AAGCWEAGFSHRMSKERNIRLSNGICLGNDRLRSGGSPASPAGGEVWEPVVGAAVGWFLWFSGRLRGGAGTGRAGRRRGGRGGREDLRASCAACRTSCGGDGSEPSCFLGLTPAH